MDVYAWATALAIFIIVLILSLEFWRHRRQQAQGLAEKAAREAGQPLTLDELRDFLDWRENQGLPPLTDKQLLPYWPRQALPPTTPTFTGEGGLLEADPSFPIGVREGFVFFEFSHLPPGFVGRAPVEEDPTRSVPREDRSP